MRAMPLQLLTWGTIAAAVSSAVMLSSSNQKLVFCSVGYRATSQAIGLEIPVEPARAGAAAKPRAEPGKGVGTSAVRPI